MLDSVTLIEKKLQFTFLAEDILLILVLQIMLSMERIRQSP